METMESLQKQLMSEEEQPQTAQQPVQKVEAALEQPSISPVEMRAQTLVVQAKTIQRVTGVDVMAVYNADVEVRNHILSGAWDFVDVYKSMNLSPAPPAPVRNANGVELGQLNVNAMTESQFVKLNDLLKMGGTIAMGDPSEAR